MNQAISIREIIEQNNDGSLALSENSMSVIAMLAHGTSVAATSKALGVSVPAIDKMMAQPGFASMLSIVKGRIDEWHKTQLSMAGVIAWKKIIDFLSEDLKPSDALFKEQIKLADSVSRRVVEQKLFVEEKKPEEVEEVTLQLHSSSVDLIARRISSLQEESGSDGVGPTTMKRSRVDSLPPVIMCHPKTSYGVVSRGEDGYRLCHLCGSEEPNFYDHIERKHKMNARQYAAAYGIDELEFSSNTE
jgi:hypothetical protein